MFKPLSTLLLPLDPLDPLTLFTAAALDCTFGDAELAPELIFELTLRINCPALARNRSARASLGL
jgi:hypothetical protein